MPPLTQTSTRSTLGPRPRIGSRAAFYLLASIIVSFLAASSAPTPLYATYQATWGFSPITVTVIFGVYAFVFLAALLTVGALPDHLGRRPVVLVAVILQAVAVLIFVQAGSVTALLLARALQGLSAGGAVGALGAGLLVAFLPDPTRLVYVVLLAILLAQAIGVVLIAETSPRAPARWHLSARGLLCRPRHGDRC
jgi:MFS family permease